MWAPVRCHSAPALLVLVACGGDTISNPGQGKPGSGGDASQLVARGGGVGGLAGGADVSEGGAFTADCGGGECVLAEPCADTAARLKALFPASADCTVVVRVGYADRVLHGYQVFCGLPATVTETTARDAVARDTGIDLTWAKLRSGSGQSEFTFEQPASDIGAIAAVSARTGLTVFAATVIYMGTGSVIYPPDWRDPAELGTCPDGPAPPTAGWIPAGVMLEFMPSQPVSAIWRTTLPLAMAHGSVNTADVFVYAPSADGFDGGTAEYVVFVDWTGG